jgi:hypothetical protein
MINYISNESTLITSSAVGVELVASGSLRVGE